MAKNKSLNEAGKAKKDEFYTQLTDIEKEMRYYRKHFKDKTVLCNCDDPFESNFFKFFALNFNRLGLKKLIATCYYSSPIAGQQLQYSFDSNGQMTFGYEDKRAEEGKNKRPYKAVVTQVYDKMGDGGVDMLDVAELFRSGENELVELEGNGDFRSQECLDLLDEADLIVTNPPFSLFREYVGILIEHKKKFLIIGNQNAITYKEIFHLMMRDQLWLGSTTPKEFVVPFNSDDRKNTYVREDGTIIAKFGNVCWFTNLDLKKRHEELILVKHYISEEYPGYDNYDAINVGKTVDIPCDYAGFMGVPITFLAKYNPDQFEIIMMANGNARTNTEKGVLQKVGYIPNDSDKGGLGVINGKREYARIIIRNKHPEPPKEVK